MINRIKGLPKFIKEVKEELKKVNWSTRQELVSAGFLVLIVSIILTSYIFCVDLGLAKLVQLVLK